MEMTEMKRRLRMSRVKIDEEGESASENEATSYLRTARPWTKRDLEMGFFVGSSLVCPGETRIDPLRKDCCTGSILQLSSNF